MEIKKYVLISLSALFFFLFAEKNVLAQYEDTVIVVAPYQPTLSDAFKIKSEPRISDTTKLTIQPKYSITSYRFLTQFTPEPINAAKIGPEPLNKLYSNYIKAGFGTYTTPYAEYFYNSKRSKKHAFGMHLKHLSSSGKIKNYGFAGYSDNQADVYYKRFLPKHTLMAKTWYKRNVNHFYGYNADDSLASDIGKKDIRQCFNNVGLLLKANSTYHDSSRLVHSFGLKYDWLGDVYKASEHQAGLNADLLQEFKLFKFTKSQLVGVKFNGDVFAHSMDTISQTSGLIRLNPYIETSFNNVKFHIGLNADIHADSNTAIKFYPNIRMDLNIIRHILVLYGGVKGSTERISMHYLAERNPYVTSMPKTGFMHNSVDLFGGFRGNITKYVDFFAEVHVGNRENMPFFLRDTLEPLNNRFSVLYDDVEYIEVQGEMTFKVSEIFGFRFGGRFNEISMTTEDEAWHIPSFRGNAAINYIFKDKIRAEFELFAYSKRNVKRFENGLAKTESIPGFVDMNFMAEYRYSKILAFFLQFNNLAAGKYQLWDNYPVQRFRFMAGLSYSF